MTSGQFTSFPYDRIYVDRESRQRKVLEGIEELALSIKNVGLINPLVIERDGRLRAGERRLTAVGKLGWTHVSVQFVDELAEAALQLLELEENVKRQALPWQDECLAIHKYHQLRSKENDWTDQKTAEALGLGYSTFASKLGVAREILADNKRVIEAPKYSVARGITERTRARASANAIKSVSAFVEGGAGISGAAVSGGDASPGRDAGGLQGSVAREADGTTDNAAQAPLLCADFIEWQASYDPEKEGLKFNFIHCDFPYGVNADKHDQGASSSFGGYEDSFETYEALIEALEKGMENVVAESAHLMFWFSMDYYSYTLERLEGMGWRIDPFPLIWHKSDNSGILPDPSRGPRRVYETCFFGSRGDRKIVRAVSNLFGAPNVKTVHMSQKNQAMLTKFMGMFVDGYSTVLDPTCGSGSALKAAVSCGAQRVLGLEANAEFHANAMEHWNDED